MKIGIIGPSNFESLLDINPYAEEVVKRFAKFIAESGHEIVVSPDKNSISEFFANEYSSNNGKKVYEVLPLDDKEFGYDWVNTELGEHINCETWRNQPEKFNESTDILLCLGYAVGVLAEIAYTKWFKPKKVYIIKDLVSGELPKEINRRLDIDYITFGEFQDKIQVNQNL